MGVMEKTWYLPDEALNFRNYPEVSRVVDDIEKIVLFGMRVSDALEFYNKGVLDRISVDIIELQKHIVLCRQVSETLGKADKVCFDILLALREIQSVMQTLMYVKNRYGNQYVGIPTENTSEANPNVIG